MATASSDSVACAIRDPTQVLCDLYASNQNVDDLPQRAEAHFESIFREPDAFDTIPPLHHARNLSHHASGSLVRFCSMIQDTSPSPEMYLATVGSRPGGWGIHAADDADSIADNVDIANLREASVMWAVSVPGQTEWSYHELCGSRNEGVVQSTDRPSRPHKFPIPGAPHVGVQIKLYGAMASRSLKATDVATFVGIMHMEDTQSSELDTPIQVPTLHVLFMKPHTSLSERPFPMTVAASLATASSNSETHSPTNASAVSSIRSELLSWLANQALGGDLFAAEWILLVLIARVQTRNPPLLPPSLTIARFPAPAAAQVRNPVANGVHSANGTNPSMSNGASATPPPPPSLSHVLDLLLPLFLSLPLSLPFLNGVHFAPHSADEDLHSGVLQLPRGTTVLGSEAGIEEGVVQAKGLANIHALQEVISAQTLAYKFPFSSFTFDTEIGVIIAAQGRGSAFFKTELTVPLVMTDQSFSNASPEGAAVTDRLYKPKSEIALPADEKLAAFRDLILGARVGRVRVGAEVSEHIQEDFVRARQAHKATAEDLILQMTIAKLYALSHHEEELTIELWNRAMALDERRRARLGTETIGTNNSNFN